MSGVKNNQHPCKARGLVVITRAPPSAVRDTHDDTDTGDITRLTKQLFHSASVYSAIGRYVNFSIIFFISFRYILFIMAYMQS